MKKVFSALLFSFLALSISHSFPAPKNSIDNNAFDKGQILVKQIGQKQYEVHLKPSLNFQNSIIGFGHFDKILHVIIKDDSSNVIVTRLQNYFLITTDKLEIKNAYIRVEKANGAFEYYPFVIKSK